MERQSAHSNWLGVDWYLGPQGIILLRAKSIPRTSEDVQFTLSASWTSQICSPVDGLHAGNTFPLTESCHSLLMKICRETTRLVK